MATDTQKKFREEMKELQKENPTYFDNINRYNKRTSSLKRKVFRNFAFAGAAILVIRILLFIFSFVIPYLPSEIVNWFNNIFSK